jgi:hypothetical protein
MYRIVIALGLVTVGALPAAAQTPGPRPLPAATMARIRAESLQARQDAERDRLLRTRAQGTAPRSLGHALTPRPPKPRPTR